MAGRRCGVPSAPKFPGMPQAFPKPAGMGQHFLGPPTPAPMMPNPGHSPELGFTGGFSPPGQTPLNIPMGPVGPGFPRRRR
jgi:hypothetical protein